MQDILNQNRVEGRRALEEICHSSTEDDAYPWMEDHLKKVEIKEVQVGKQV